jgi:DNA-binding beta-propeller fold protein YncE
VATLQWWGANLAGGSYAFNVPYGEAFDGSHIWVTNYLGSSVTELNASDGSWIRTLSGGSYGFNAPFGMAFDGSHMWVTNYYGNSVTELPVG